MSRHGEDPGLARTSHERAGNPRHRYNSRMGDLIHTSKIRIFQDKPPERRAYVEGFEAPLEFGVHGGIKHFYRMEPKRDLPATLDHMIAAVGG